MLIKYIPIFLLFVIQCYGNMAELTKLKEGNERFVRDKSLAASRVKQIESQNPFCAVLACSDSRVATEILFDQGIGDLFVVRLAGNVASETAIESLEFAVTALNVPLIFVLGHQNCGAVSAVLEHRSGDLEKIAGLIEDGIKGKTDLENAIKANVNYQIEILKKNPVFQQKIKEGKLSIRGGYYDFQTGKVSFFEN